MAILGAEVVLIALVSQVDFGERFTPQELLGVTLVLIGTAIAWY